MRVDLIITELYVGGAERSLTELALGLAERGDRVRVISLQPLPPESRAELLQRLAEAEIPVASVGFRRWWQLPVAAARLERLLADDPPQVVQTFLYHGNVLGTLAAARCGVPVRVGGVRVAQPRPQRWWVERWAVRRMSALVCVSEGVAQFARRRLKAETLPVCVIGNAIDPRRFDSEPAVDWGEYGITPGGKVVLFLGRLHHQKGVDWLLEAAAPLLQQLDEARLVMVGDGPMRAAAERRVSQLPPGRAAVLGWRPRVGPLLQGAAVLVLPSRYEGMPNVILEAMAAGCPVVTTPVEGVQELLGSDPRQRVTFGATDALIERVALFLRDAGERSQVVSSNRVAVSERFSIERMVEAYRALYLELWERNSAAP